jgi:hypothetical protein
MLLFADNYIFHLISTTLACYMVFMPKRCSKWQEAKRFGVDMSLLEANLAKTPTQRVRDHLSALELAQKLSKAGEKYHARIRKTA